MKHAKIIALAVVGVLAIVIFIQNAQVVETRLLFVTVKMPRAMLLMLTLLVGFGLGVLAPTILKTLRKGTGGEPQKEGGGKSEKQDAT